jgi:integrase
MVYEPGEDVNVTAHGMRGLHSTLAIEAGMTGAVVAASLGHEHVSATIAASR